MNDLDRTEFFIREALKSLGITATVDTEHESDSEAWINIHTDTGYGLSLFLDSEGEARTIGNRIVKRTRWGLYKIVHFPGTREEPPSEDLAHVRDFTNMQEAIAEAFAAITKDHVQCMIESIGYQRDTEEINRIAEENGYHGLRGKA